ncbi:hypothetical protein CGMCC3_g6516 [Colletotrichum fructicola]|nr:uncharacterized protein CGMCC3_g6516 [Colletotrichum fructicola]KAE9577587.1 hypothetical protein CGMCC3_g6516 [Colletotrichum fructicola]
MPAMGCDWFVGIRTRHLLTSVDRDVWAACRSALRLSLTHTHSRLSLSSGFLQRLRLRMRGRRRRRDHTGGEEREGGQDSSPVVDVDLFPSLSLQVDAGPGTYTTWTEVTALLAPDVAPVDRHKVRPINCHDQDPGGPPTYPAIFADPWPECGHRLYGNTIRATCKSRPRGGEEEPGDYAWPIRSLASIEALRDATASSIATPRNHISCEGEVCAWVWNRTAALQKGML